MVVDAVAEPHTLEVLFHGHKVGISAVALVVTVGLLQKVTNLQVVASVLVEQNVASPKGSFLQVIDECLLLQRELLETVHTIAQHLDVGKTFVCELKTVLLGGSAAG